MGDIAFEQVWKVYPDGTQAVRAVDLEVADAVLVANPDPWHADATLDCVTRRTQPAASAADFRHDLDLFGAMVELMAGAERAAV